MPDASNPIILYDGVCGFCNRMVQFILKRDAHDRFRFAPLQSGYSRSLLAKHEVKTENFESLYLVLDNGTSTERIEERSTAAISIFRELGVFWRTIANVLAIFPKNFCDWPYNLIARNRYRIFGKYDTCPLPKIENRHKFLDVA
jgi:predicted DCC family thiol-disulfide oxidoreductase YuxK